MTRIPAQTARRLLLGAQGLLDELWRLARSRRDALADPAIGRDLAERVRAVQEAMAAEPRPVHVPREPKPPGTRRQEHGKLAFQGSF